MGDRVNVGTRGLRDRLAVVALLALAPAAGSCLHLAPGGGGEGGSDDAADGAALAAPPPRRWAPIPTVAELDEASRRPRDEPYADGASAALRPPSDAAPPGSRAADVGWAGPESGPLSWPVQGGRLSLRFGAVEGGVHHGVDVVAADGAGVLAAAAGLVRFAGLRRDGYGNVVLLDHEGGWQTAYAHNDVNLVREGDRILAGQVIARAGRTGAPRPAAPTLHFEVRRAGRAANPLNFLYLPGPPPDPAAEPCEGGAPCGDQGSEPVSALPSSHAARPFL